MIITSSRIDLFFCARSLSLSLSFFLSISGLFICLHLVHFMLSLLNVIMDVHTKHLSFYTHQINANAIVWTDEQSGKQQRNCKWNQRITIRNETQELIKENKWLKKERLYCAFGRTNTDSNEKKSPGYQCMVYVALFFLCLVVCWLGAHSFRIPKKREQNQKLHSLKVSVYTEFHAGHDEYVNMCWSVCALCAHTAQILIIVITRYVAI